nr:Uncharacterised protein [Escherichia coli]
MDYRCRHHHNVDAEGEGAGDELRVLITVLLSGFGPVQRCAVQKRKAFSLLIFPAGIKLDDRQPSF